MNILDINISEYLQEIIDTYVKIFGEEYRSIIEERIKNVEFIPYNTENGVTRYIEFLEKCKQRELAIKFFKEIGVDVSSYEGKSYAKEVSKKLRKLVVEYIGGYSGFYDYFAQNNIIGIRAFDREVQERNSQYKSEIKRNQIIFLNLLLGEETIISEEELEEFFKTDEYKEIEEKIQRYNEIYNGLFEEFKEYERKLQPYRDFIEKRRKEKDIRESEQYQSIILKMRDSDKSREILEEIFYTERIMTYFGEFVDKPTIFYTIHSDGLSESGKNDYTLLHEFCHAVEVRKKGNVEFESGFDYVGNGELNPYNKNKRKYERLNETITDIFSIQATRILHERNKYIIDTKETSDDNMMDENTSSILKKMIMPFLEQYKREIIRARLTGDKKELFDKIGEENFERLNDCINKVDYLISEGLKKDIVDKKDSELVKEYKRQLEVIQQIYADMVKVRMANQNKEER